MMSLDDRIMKNTHPADKLPRQSLLTYFYFLSLRPPQVEVVKASAVRTKCQSYYFVV